MAEHKRYLIQESTLSNLMQAIRTVVSGSEPITLTEVPSKITEYDGELLDTQVSYPWFAQIPGYLTLDNLFYNSSSQKLTSLGQNLKKIIIDDMVNIPDQAFRECNNLVSAIIPNVTSIGAGAFFHCVNLEGDFILSKLRWVNAQAFTYCSKITKFSAPYVANIPTATFSDCTALKEVNTPYCSIIGGYAFTHDENLTDITFSKTGVLVGDNAFQSTGLTEIDLNNWRLNGNSIFAECSKLTKVHISTTLSNQSIPDYTFHNDSELISLYQSGYNEIGSHAFEGCEKLDTIYLSDVQTVGSYAFYNSSRCLTFKNIDNLVHISEYAFYNGASQHYTNDFPISQIVFIGAYGLYGQRISNSTFANGVMLQDHALANGIISGVKLNNPYFDGIGQFASCNITDAIEIIGNNSNNSIPAEMFLHRTNANHVITISKYRTIGARAFERATHKYDTVNWDGQVEVIYPHAFKNCGIKELDLSEVKQIGAGAFYANDFTTINLGGLTNWIEDENDPGQQFAENENLTAVNNLTLTTIPEKCFKNCLKLQQIDLSQVTTIMSEAFYRCSSLADINLTNCLTIGESAFFACTFLTNINLPKCTSVGKSAFYAGGVTKVAMNLCDTIASGTFYECANLTSVEAKKCKEIGEYAFYNCTQLTKVVDSPYLTIIGSNAYRNDRLLTTINIEATSDAQSLQLHEYAFSACQNLIEVMGTRITKIGSSAFQNCVNLTTVNLPNCTTIESYAFYNCGALKNLYLQNIEQLNCYFSADTMKLSDIIIGNKINAIPNNAFKNQSDMAGTVDLTNCKTIGKSAFYKCSKLTFSGDWSLLESINDNAFCYASGVWPETLNCTALTTLGQSVFEYCGIQTINMPLITDLPMQTFYSCSLLKQVTFNTTAYKSVRAGTFNNCINLQEIPGASELETIGMYAFRNCNSIKTVNLPNVVRIETQAFDGARIKTVDIPKCTFLGTSAFRGALLTYFRGEAVTEVQNDVFASNYNLSIIRLPNCLTLSSSAFGNGNRSWDKWTLYLNSNTMTQLNAPLNLFSGYVSSYLSKIVVGPLVDQYKADPYWSYLADYIVSE